jgi:hypothetical protein
LESALWQQFTIFSPNHSPPTKWSTAEQKAKFANQLMAFIAADFPENKFTKALYNRLSQCFGMIAHYVEGVIMRSTNVNTAWIQRSNTRLLCIITRFRLSAPSQLPHGP